MEVEDETHFSSIASNPIRAAFFQNEYCIPCSVILMNCTLRPGIVNAASPHCVPQLSTDILTEITKEMKLHRFIDKMFAPHGTERQCLVLHKILAPPRTCPWLANV